MFNICPVRNVCFLEKDMWFVARGINGIFKYSDKNDTLELHALPGPVNSDFMTLATYQYKGHIFIVPQLNKGFIDFDTKNNSYNIIETAHCRKTCNFNDSFLVNDSIFCIPNDKKGPFVMFSMREKNETNRVYYFPDSLDYNFFPILTQKVSNEMICALLRPNNIIYFLNIFTGEFSFVQNSHIKEEIESFLAIDDYLYISTQNEILVTDLNMDIIEAKKRRPSNRTHFIGKYENYAFLEVINEREKKLIRYDGKGIQEIVFNDTQILNEVRYGGFGTIHYNDSTKEYLYFNGTSCGFYTFKAINDEIKYKYLDVDHSIYNQIMTEFNIQFKENNVNNENIVFGLKDYIKGVNILW